MTSGFRSNRSIFEIVSSLALIGMGSVGVVSPKGLEASSFFPVMREVISPLALAVIVFTVGFVRFLTIIYGPDLVRLRSLLAGFALLIWAQWFTGFVQVANVQGLRPGMGQMAAFVFGEALMVYWLARGRWNQS